MASANPFDLLGDNDNEDPSAFIAAQQLIAALQQQQLKAAPKKTLTPVQATAQKQQPQLSQAKMPSKPLPPAQAVKEARNEASAGRGGGRSGGRGLGRGRGSSGSGGGFNRDFGSNENAFNSGAADDGDVRKSSERGRGGPRGAFRGGRRGGFSNGEEGDGDRPSRRQFERRSGTGRGNEVKREGSGCGNWGTQTDEAFVQETEEVTNVNEKNLSPGKQPADEDASGVNKENTVTEPEEKEPEDKEMTLEQYEKILEEKRKALQALKTEERRVDLDKDFESMQQLSKKSNDDVFIKLGSEKDKRKEFADKEEKLKRPVSINEFLKPAEGEKYYGSGGRGRGRGSRGRGGGSSGGYVMNNAAAPSIEDPGQFPTLGGK